MDALKISTSKRQETIDITSEVKSAILGPSETVPVKDSRLLLGKWQSLMLVELDGPRERKIVVSVIGD